MSVLYKKVFCKDFALLLHMHTSVYLVFNKRGSTGVNGAAVSTDGELLPRFIISDPFMHVCCFVGFLYAVRR